jgi:hypothetical protein
LIHAWPGKPFYYADNGTDYIAMDSSRAAAAHIYRTKLKFYEPFPIIFRESPEDAEPEWRLKPFSQNLPMMGEGK